MTERKTRKEIIRFIPNREAETVKNELKALASEIGDSFSKVFKSITADNGSEFAELSFLEQITESKIYFAPPYTSMVYTLPRKILISYT